MLASSKGVDFVQHAERAGAELEDGQQQGDGGEGLFAAGEEQVVELRFAGGRGDDLHQTVVKFIGDLFDI